MNRILLKLSGEALAGGQKTGFDDAIIGKIATQIKTIIDNSNGETQVAISLGGGNFWRGAKNNSIDRTKSDQLGMLATLMNCIYVGEIFRNFGMKTHIFSPFTCGTMAELYSKDRAVECLEAGQVVFFAAGVGHPFFSSDSGVILRALEINADQVLLAKAIDGVYDDDPATNPEAKKYGEVSLDEAVRQNLRVMDLTALVMARDNKMPLLVFGLDEENSIINALNGTSTGTKVTV